MIIVFTKEQKAAIAKEYVLDLIKDHLDWFRDFEVEHADEEAVEKAYEVSLLRQTLNYF